MYKATGGRTGQMEGREDVSLIDATEKRGWKQGRVVVVVMGAAATVVVVGGWLSNSAKITDTSALHLQRSHQAFNVSCL